MPPATALLADPETTTPDRRPGSVRRTSNVDMVWSRGDDIELRLFGGARDVRTTRDGRVDLLGEASLAVDVDRERSVRAIHLVPARRAADGLIGANARLGFRRLLAELLPDERGTPLGLLLDDVPVAALIAGFATMREDRAAGIDPMATMPHLALERQVDICAGWRADGSMVTSIRAGGGVPLQDCPAAPAIEGDDAWSWHAMEDRPPFAMRRRRRIDTWRAGDRIEVDAMFRDSFWEHDGREGVLHEYSLTASADADGRLVSITAVPHVLPYFECPAAAGHVAALVGLPLADFRTAVAETVTGTRSCTHLNDLLRCLADVPALVDAGSGA